mgnify:FL=1
MLVFSEVLEQDPKNGDAHLNRGLIQKYSARPYGAKKSFQAAVDLNDIDPEAHQCYSTALAYLCDWRDVIKHSDIAISLSDANDIWGLRLFTWIYQPDLDAQAICDEFENCDSIKSK